jgi:signal transduction histidine kinase
VSHEVRTPITAVLGYADLLGAGIGGPLTEEQRSYVERLRRARGTCSASSRPCWTCRASTPTPPPPSGRRRVGDVVRPRSRWWSRRRASGPGAVADLRTQAEGLSYWGDEARVRQILVNLLANAVKFAQPRDGAPAGSR